jgi:small subunit ribosomal protein S6
MSMGGKRMRIYETMFIIDPNLEDEARDELANRVKGWVEEKVKGKVESFDRWGIRQLAFRVDKFYQGDYSVLVFEADPQNVKALEDMYRITPQIFRWMVFRREDLEEQRKKEAEKGKNEEATEEVSEVVEEAQALETNEVNENDGSTESVETTESAESAEAEENEKPQEQDEGENY